MKALINNFRLRHPKYFLSQKETLKLCELIDHFEKASGCELVFHFRHKLGVQPFEKARELFYKFELDKTSHRAAILIAISFDDRKYAVYTDKNVDPSYQTRSEEGLKFWDKIGNLLANGLGEKKRLETLERVLETLTQSLALSPQEKETSKNLIFNLSNKPKIESEE